MDATNSRVYLQTDLLLALFRGGAARRARNGVGYHLERPHQIHECEEWLRRGSFLKGLAQDMVWI